MLAAASSFFARTNISQNYIVSAPGQALPPPANGLPAPPPCPPFTVGLWKVTNAAHKTTGKRVSVWTCEKRSTDIDRCSPQGRERVLEVLKAEASALGRLRHPCILVEPLEETRTELVFATEMLLSTLQLAIPPVGPHTTVELDEIEILKGILQLCKGLSFLHTSARLIHSNVNPTTVVINAAGDWKISGLGLTVPLIGNDGSPSRWEYLQYDSKMPSYVQRSFDYLAPEYSADTPVAASSDMWSLGCLIYAVNNKGNPPHRNHGNLTSLRDNARKHIGGMDSWDPDLRGLVSTLVTSNASSRPSPSSLPSYSAFSSLPISTLNFLDRTNFAAKTREEKIIFMKGLSGVLDRFSDGLKTRKILPSLLEEMKDSQLLPSILPNVFAISSSLTPTQFASTVLPSLKPLFAVKEPPQNMLTLLDNLELLQGKTEKAVFKEHVLPLVYHALESEHAVVQERALDAVPALCDTIDYAEVQSVLFPRVALVFTKTRILTVKVATLVCFKSMVQTLDQSSLTQKLVPLLSKIRTKEPAVMLATLDVQEAMGLKVDRDAVATLVLPQLWTMSIGPLLNVTQFSRFMQVIKTLSERVEREHMQFLKDTQRIEDRSTASSGGINGTNSASAAMTGTINFQSLVGGSSAPTSAVMASSGVSVAAPAKSWDDDVWGSILGDQSSAVASVAIADAVTSSLSPTLSPPLTPPTRSPSSLSTSAFSIPQSSPTLTQPPSFSMPAQFTPMMPSAPLQPTMGAAQAQRPNYNISFTAMTPTPATPPASSPLPGMSSPSMVPLAPTSTSWSNPNAGNRKQDFSDFDPLL
ncbi:kinase-like protein [Auriculariales sp. MPI-PUGE-AT-0066]|nr:kinase-like protein [Auriculariales sp. MPI-PUGE-AT-0066]